MRRVAEGRRGAAVFTESAYTFLTPQWLFLNTVLHQHDGAGRFEWLNSIVFNPLLRNGVENWPFLHRCQLTSLTPPLRSVPIAPPFTNIKGCLFLALRPFLTRFVCFTPGPVAIYIPQPSFPPQHCWTRES